MLISQIKQHIVEAVTAAKCTVPDNDAIVVEYPKNREHGDFATNVAMVMAKTERKNPLVLAEQLVKFLKKNALFSSVSAVKPGFINFTIAPHVLRNALKDIHQKNDTYGFAPELQKGKRVLIEFVSANPTGPLNVVNARAAAFGDTLANILTAVGASVEREYYVNDAGNQIDLLVESVDWALTNIDNPDADPIEDGYKGHYIREIAEQLVEVEGNSVFNLSKKQLEEKIRDFSLTTILENQKQVLEDFGVHFDNWISENDLRQKGCVEDVLTYLYETELIYEKDGAVWFATEKLGDEKDRVLMRADGSVTYMVPDLAYHITKYKRGYDEMIDILGPDHHGYVPRLNAGLTALNYNIKKLHFILLQHVTLMQGNEKVKMSKREGKIVTLRQLIEDVGTDAARFFFLMRRANSPLDFDMELAKKQSNENPVFYVQYAHARICSIEKQAKKAKLKLKDFKPEYLERLTHKEEHHLINTLLRYPELIIHIAKSHDVHMLTSYLQDLAAEFHSYYQKSKVINPRYAELSMARYYLCAAVRIVLNNGLKMMEISVPDKM